MRYRPDIDGLRAIAVVPVVLFHAGAFGFGGGYIGVDIFFVISGYLITSIIVSEMDSDSFSIAVFYQRRVRRIFPALVSIIAFCMAVGFFLLTPSDYRSLGQSVVATAFFVSNIFFWQQTSYFDTPAGEKPLLHTWSLSIEEQFYLLYPLFLFLLSTASRAVRIYAVALACLLSFAACAVLVYYKPSAAFYLGPTRAWELLTGGLLALGGMPISHSRRVTHGAALAGIALIALPVFFYSPSTRFPGLAALPPVTGAGLLIWSGLEKQTSIHKLLATPFLAGVGKASYSLYLWHFPLLAFARYSTLGRLDPYVAAAICFLSVVISFASLRFVERPFRFPSRDVKVRRIVSFALATMVIVAGVGFLVDLGNGLPSRMTAASMVYLDVEEQKDSYFHWECMSLEQRIVRPAEACKLGSKGAQPSALLWGDSHAVVTAMALEQAATRNRASFLFAASVDCPIGKGLSIDPGIGPSFVATPGYQFCGEYNKEMLKLATDDSNIVTVVLSSRWTNWRIGEQGSPAEAKVDIRLRNKTGVAKSISENREIFARGFESLVQSLVTLGKTVWIVGPLPQPSVRVPKALYIKSLGFDSTDIDIPRETFSIRNEYIMSLFDKIAKKDPVRFIWPHTALCDKEICPVVENGNPMYFDNNHLSVFGVEKTSSLYDDVFSR